MPFPTESTISVIIPVHNWGVGFQHCLVGAWWPGFLTVAVVLSMSLLALNAPVYGFFIRQRGLWFALQVIPWHWLYYFYSGLAFAIGTDRFHFRKWRSPRTRLSTVSPK